MASSIAAPIQMPIRLYALPQNDYNSAWTFAATLTEQYFRE